jgi:hypothetical protein
MRTWMTLSVLLFTSPAFAWMCGETDSTLVFYEVHERGPSYACCEQGDALTGGGAACPKGEVLQESEYVVSGYCPGDKGWQAQCKDLTHPRVRAHAPAEIHANCVHAEPCLR